MLKKEQSDANETDPSRTLIDTKQLSPTIRLSTQIVTFSWYLYNRRDARVGSHTHAKTTIIREKSPVKSNIFVLNKTEILIGYSVAITKTGRKSNLWRNQLLLGAPGYLT